VEAMEGEEEPRERERATKNSKKNTSRHADCVCLPTFYLPLPLSQPTIPPFPTLAFAQEQVVNEAEKQQKGEPA